MDFTDRATNPYAAPTTASVLANAERKCSYCGEPGNSDRKLVESPDGSAWICRNCAAIVVQTIDGRRVWTFWSLTQLIVQNSSIVLLIGLWIFGNRLEAIFPSPYGLLGAVVGFVILVNAIVWFARRAELRRSA